MDEINQTRKHITEICGAHGGCSHSEGLINFSIWIERNPRSQTESKKPNGNVGKVVSISLVFRSTHFQLRFLRPCRRPQKGQDVSMSLQIFINSQTDDEVNVVLFFHGSMENLLRSAAEASPALIVRRSFSDLIKVRRDVSCDRKSKTATDLNGGYREVKAGKHFRVLSSIINQWNFQSIDQMDRNSKSCLDVTRHIALTVLTEQPARQSRVRETFEKRSQRLCTMLRSRYISGRR